MSDAKDHGVLESTFPLSEGTAILRWPDNISSRSFTYVEAWMVLQLKAIKGGIDARETGESFSDPDDDVPSGVIRGRIADSPSPTQEQEPPDAQA